MSGETEFSQKTIADESHACHVTAVFEQTQEEEKQYDDRDKTDNCSNAAKDAVDDKRLHRRRDIPACESFSADASQPLDAVIQEVLKWSTEDIDGKIDDSYHHEDENRDGGPFSGEDFINCAAALIFFAFLRFYYRF